MKRMLRINPRSNEYNEYLHNHVINVISSWENCLKPALINSGIGDYSKYDVDAIGDIIKYHDASKYTSDEYFAYLNYFYPTDKFPKDETAFDKAWLHHQHSNPHHWQHWVVVRDEGNIVPLDMPFAYICEMICDWHSFSAKDPNNTAYNWYKENGNKMILSDNTRSTVEMLIEFMKTPL